MALDHVVVSLPSTTVTALYTVPAGATHCHVTIQNRDTTAAMAVGDSTLSSLSGANGGVYIPVASSSTAPSTFQTWLNSGDTIYGISSATMTNTCIVLASYVQTAR